jgi:hypothetical protein
MHLATGRLISQGAYAFGSDPFAYTTEGTSWINHTWLADFAAYMIGQAAGGADQPASGAILVLIKALIIALLAVVMISTRRPKQRPWLPAVITALAIWTLSQRLLLQPICISFLFLGLTILLLHRSQEASSKRWMVGILALPILFALWANLDEWYLIGPFAVGLFLIGQVVQQTVAPIRGSPDAPRPGSILTLALVFIAGVAACFATPYHIHGFTLPPEISAIVGAWPLESDAWFQPYFQMGLFGRDYISNPGTWPFLGLLALGIVSFIVNREGLRWWRVLLFVAFFLPTARMARLVPFFAIVAGPITALNFMDFAARQWGSVLRVDSTMKNWLVGGRIGTLVAGVLLLVLAWPGWLHGGSEDPRRTRRVAWAIEVDPSFHSTALKLAELRSAGILSKDSRGFNYLPDIANYCAYFSPEEKGFFDHRFQLFSDDLQKSYVEIRRAFLPKGRQDSGDQDAAVWEAAFRDKNNRIDHVVISSVDHVLAAAVTWRLWRDQDQFTLLYTDGRSSILGWSDPLAPARRDLFRAQAFNPVAVAFAEAKPESRAPETGPGFPQKAGLLSSFVNGPPPRPFALDQAYMYLEYYDLVSQVWPRYFDATAILSTWAGPSMAVAGGAGFCIFPATLGYMIVAPPDAFLTSMAAGSPGALILGVRAARQAILASPEDPESYLVLAEAYKNLWLKQERVWARNRAPLLEQIRDVQVASALQTALALRPNDIKAHTALATIYQQQNFIDLEIHHLNEVLNITRSQGPGKGEPADNFEKRLTNFENYIDARRKATNIEKIQTEFELRRQTHSLLEQAQMAFQMGLVKQAQDIIREGDPSQLGQDPSGQDAGAFLVRLDFLTGEIDEIRRAGFFNLEDWANVLINLANGDYQNAQETLEQLHRRTGETNARNLLALVRRQTFQSGLQPADFGQLAQSISSTNQALDYRFLAALVALEAGNIAKAREEFHKGLTQSFPTNRAAGGVSLLGGSLPLDTAVLRAHDALSQRLSSFQPSLRSVALRYSELLDEGKARHGDASAHASK